MAEDQIEEVKRKTDIVELIGEFIELKRAGTNFRALCPFHGEKTPSFMVSPELQIFKCFGCGLGGDAYRFLMEYEKFDFPQALKFLAQRAGVKLAPRLGYSGFAEKEEIYKLNHTLLEFYHYLLTSHPIGKSGLSYLKKRGVGDEAIEVFGLGFAPDIPDSAFQFLTVKKGYKPEVVEKAGVVVKKDGRYFDRFRARIIFPLKDHHGNVLGFAGRVIEDRGEVAKYINTPDTLVYKKGHILYGLEITKQDIKKAGFAVIVEGELDAISSFQAGVRNVIAIKGSALTPEQASLLSRFCQQVRLALDSDIAGDQAARRGIEIVQKAGLEQRVVRLGDEHDLRKYDDLGKYKDPDEMAKKAPKEFRKAIERAEDIYDFLINSSFARFDATTTEGKGRIGRELAPILAQIEDEIVKAHCVRQVAERLGVPEEAVADQVAKQKGVKKEEAEEFPKAAQVKTKRDVLEEYLLTLAFQTNPKILQEAKVKALIKTPAASRLIEEFNSWAKRHSKLKFSRFVKDIPAELVDFFATLVLSDVEKLNLDKGEDEIKNTSRALEILDMRERMGRLTEEIKTLERSGKQQALNALESELAKISSSLTQLEAK